MPDSDYCAFVPVVNRPDLLQNVLAATTFLHANLTIIDNSIDGLAQQLDIPDGVRVFRAAVQMTFSQTMNFEISETLRQGKKYCVHAHNDALIPAGACEKLLEFTRKTDAENPKWGIVHTLHDVLCAYNAKVYNDIGGYDTVFPAYFSDNDYFRRMELAGWTRILSGIEVGHVGSQTINSDPFLCFLNGLTFPLYRAYYEAKWGGGPGQELFKYEFNHPKEYWSELKITR